jgi:AP-1 complex subunit beta-1
MSSAQKAPGFFSSQNKRSEINEWRLMLNNEKESVRKDAVKKVIAAMTVGKDVQMLFSDVVKCVQTNNIELKKLVYLYIMNYAKTQPDLAILAVNTFEKVFLLFHRIHHNRTQLIPTHSSEVWQSAQWVAFVLEKSSNTWQIP